MVIVEYLPMSRLQEYIVTLLRLRYLRLTALLIFVAYITRTPALSEAIFFHIIKPKRLSYLYQINPSYQIGARLPPYTMHDVGLVYADPPEACEPLANADYANGEVVLIERGHCTFAEKVINAEQAGAIMAIITDSSADNDEFVEMIIDDTGRRAGIPAAFLPGSSGRRIRQYLLYEKSMAFIDVPLNFTSKSIDHHIYEKPPWELW